MTDEELRKVYDEGFEGAVVAQESQAEAFSAALRAVFRAGARAQRDMKLTDEMGAAMWVASDNGHKLSYDACGRIYRAMQRVAPLVGGEK